jgi:hypothetical protein
MRIVTLAIVVGAMAATVAGAATPARSDSPCKGQAPASPTLASQVRLYLTQPPA